MATSRNAFEYTATGVLGEKRPAMLSNELHLRSELAKSKKHGYSSYPGQTFCYGMSYPSKDCGVAECLRWTTGASTAGPQTTKPKKGNATPRSRPLTFSSNLVFGVPVRPSTPINEVLGYKYQDEWIEHQQQLRKSKEQKEQAKKLAPGVFRENRTSQLRRSHTTVSVPERDLWHLPKFSSHAQRQLDTFRSDGERERAYKNQSLTTAVY